MHTGTEIKQVASIVTTTYPADDLKDIRDFIYWQPDAAGTGVEPIYVMLGDDYKYHIAPKGMSPLPAFPDAKAAKKKTPVAGGGSLRARWKDSKEKIYEWDSRHGTVEVYDRSGRNHLGEFDPITGEQTKPADPTRRVEK